METLLRSQYNDEQRYYVIFNVSELPLIDFNQVLETSLNTIRISVDGTKTLVKWEGEMPDCVTNLTTSEGPYTNEEMIDIMASSEWTPPFSLIK